MQSERPGTVGSERIVPLSVPALHGNEWRYVKECLDTGWVSSAGPFVDRFERDLAKYVGVGHAVATVNGTAALHIALRVALVREDDEVLVPTLTFIAPVNAIRYCGAHPVFIDADPATWQMDVSKVRQFLTEQCSVEPAVDGIGMECRNTRTGRRVRAILPVHTLGLACEIDRIVDLARQYALQVVEDAAEAMGVCYGGRHVGTFGDIGVFSFNGNKIITSGGGGMVVTDNPASARLARYLTTQARDDQFEYLHNEVGYNYRLTSLQAALGVAQLEQLNTFIAKKRAIAHTYATALRDLDCVTVMPCPPQVQSTYWLYTILLSEETMLTDRTIFIQALRARGIDARPLWHPIHRLPPYRHCQTVAIEHSLALYKRGLSLPCSVGMTEQQLHQCVTTVKEILAAHGVLH